MIVLDTHALLWWVDGGAKLSANAARSIEGERAGGRIIVSSISAWEIAMLVSHGRLSLSLNTGLWLAKVASIAGLEFQPVDNETAVESVLLPGSLHRDPADRIIVATARRHAASLVTADDRLRAYPHVRTVW